MGFQSGAFQTPVAFQAHIAPPAGGYGKKLDSEAFAEVYNNADRLRRRIETLPEEVKAVINEAVIIDNQAESEAVFNKKLSNIDTQFRRLYAELFRQYYQSLLDDELARMLLITEHKRKQQQAAIMLLLL